MTVPKVFAGRYLKAVEGLDELMRNYPGIQMGHHLIANLDELRSKVTHPDHLPVEIVLLDTPQEENLKKIGAFFGIDEVSLASLPIAVSDPKDKFRFEYNTEYASLQLALVFYTSAHLPVRSTSSLQPVLKLAFWTSEAAPPADEFDMIALRLQAEGGILLFVNAAEENFIKSVNQLKVINYRFDNLPDSLEALLSLKGLQTHLPLLYGTRLVHGLEKISEAFYQYVVQQEKDIKTKKFNAQQDINLVKQEEKVNLRDLYQNIKKNIQRDFTEFERGVSDLVLRMSQKQQQNSLMNKIDEEIQTITQLKEESVAGTLKMTLPDGTQEKISRMISQGLRSQIDQDIFSFKEFINQVMGDTKAELEKHQVDFTYSANFQFSLSRLEANMLEYNQFSQKYETDKKKLDFNDYLRAALKPFLTIGSLTILVKLQKDINNWYMSHKVVIFGILTPVAVYGFYQFLKHSKQQKELDYNKELLRMKDALSNESKGIIRKLGDEWLRELVSTIRDEMNNFMNQLENTFAIATEQHKYKVQENQRSVQRRIQGLEQRDRSHQSIVKNKETFDRSLAQFKGELLQQYHETIEKL